MNNNLVTDISVHNGDIRGGVAESLVPNAKKCSKLKHLFFFDCDFDDASIKDLCQRVRGLSCLEIIHLWNSRDGGSVGIESAVAIGNLLQDPSCGLIHLLLSRFQFNDECTQVIISSLIGNAKLEHLSLSHNSIGRSSCESIVNLLQSPSCNITHLNLGDCGINNESAPKIVNSLIGNTKLEDLDLSNISIGRSGYESIATLLQKPNSNITKFALSWNKLTDEYTSLLARSLIGNSKLEHLDLSHNKIERSGCESIATLLQNPTCCLTHLNLGSCGFKNELATIIVNSLIGNTKLVKLDLSSNGIGRSGCESIASLLKISSPISIILIFRFVESMMIVQYYLHKPWCSLDNESAAKIVRSLIGNTKLEKLDLSGNSIGRAGCESIATLLQDRNSNINEIELSRNEIDVQCAALLAQALVGNNKLKCLDLSGNSGITESGWNAFSAILTNCSNTTLCSLGEDYSGKDFAPNNLASLLKLNLAVNMEPLFELDSEDNERKPKALPSVIDWFGRVRESAQDEEIVNRIDERKLSAIFQFARTMPLQFVPASHFMHPSVVSLIQVRDDRDSALESKYRALQRRNTELEKEIATKEAEISSMQDAKKKLEAKEEEIRDLHGRLDSIVNVARKRKFPWD